MEDKKMLKKWVSWFIFAVLLIVIYKTLDNFNSILDFIKNMISILMPFTMAIIIAYLFYTPCKKIEYSYLKSKVNFIKNRARGFSIFTMYLLAFIIIYILFKVALPSIYVSVTDLAMNLPNYYNKITSFIGEIPSNPIINEESVNEIINNLQKIDITQWFSVEKIFSYLKSVLGVASTIFSMFVTAVVSIYILLERGEILKFFQRLCKAMFKKETNIRISRYFEKTNSIFFKFISSQIIDAIVVGVVVSIALLLLNVKYAILLGVLIGVFNIIPYFGAIIAVIISIIITAVTGGISQAIWMAIIVIVLQQIDANIINPKIVGNSLKVSPILIIFSVTIGGAYFGVLGMFLAVPVVALMKIIINDYIENKTQKKVDA